MLSLILLVITDVYASASDFSIRGSRALVLEGQSVLVPPAVQNEASPAGGLPEPLGSYWREYGEAEAGSRMRCRGNFPLLVSKSPLKHKQKDENENSVR